MFEHQLEFLDHMIILCFTFEKLPRCFPKQLHHFKFSEQGMRVLISPHFHKSLLLYAFFSVAILVDVKWHLIAL